MDGDGIPYRTLPGTPGGKGAYLTRGSGHNAQAVYTENPAEYTEVLLRIQRKILSAASVLPQPIHLECGGKRGVLAYGSSDPAVMEALDILREHHGTRLDYLRVRALPFSETIGGFLRSMEVVYVVEQNRDGQMAALLKEFFPEEAPRLRSVLHFDSTPITAQTIIDQILSQEM